MRPQRGTKQRERPHPDRLCLVNFQSSHFTRVGKTRRVRAPIGMRGCRI